jgi:hypothetical protein
VPEREFEETDHKAGAVKRAIELAIAEEADRAATARVAAADDQSGDPNQKAPTTPVGASPTGA